MNFLIFYIVGIICARQATMYLKDKFVYEYNNKQFIWFIPIYNYFYTFSIFIVYFHYTRFLGKEISDFQNNIILRLCKRFWIGHE
jgi:hypothetical protein